MTRKARRFLALALGTFAALLAGELLLRGPLAKKTFALHAPHARLTLLKERSPLIGISGPSTFSTNSLGLRGKEPQQSDRLRILCVGGSTTACEYLADEETWPARLESLLDPSGRIRVLNAGASGQRLIDHQTFLAATLADLPKIDFILLLSGINDLSHALVHQGSPPKEPPPLAPSQLERVFTQRPQPASFWPPHTLALFQRLRQARKAHWFAAAYEDEGASSYALRRATRSDTLARTAPQSPQLTKDFLRNYEERLEWLIGLASRQGITLVLLTQPTLWSSKDPEAATRCWHGFIGALPWQSPSAYASLTHLHTELTRLNLATRAVAARTGTVLLDLTPLDGNLATFYDDCHFTEQGAQDLAALLARGLQAAFPELRKTN